MRASAMGSTLALLGCDGTMAVGGSFLQPWDEHLGWSRERWGQSLSGMRELGCEEVFLQWVGLEGEPQPAWDARAPMVQMLLDQAAEQGMGVHLGLPYNEAWWKVIHQPDLDRLADFLRATGAHGTSYMQSVSWPGHAAFRGWYIPYELEQYHWGSAARIAMLVPWLKGLSDAAIATSGREPSVSTYSSEMESGELLAQVWSVLLDHVVVRPMLQDGVGVHGIANYERLEPLHRMLLRRGTGFDLIVEVFERLPDAANMPGEFRARPASFERLQAQWGIAREYGARRIVAYALDPWVTGASEESARLRSAWRAAMPQP
ncbi:DUF4434 domain-containing protein [Diaphorobacter ruginosibacter]|uniref:DUF4434 domain-containing protein n=1 Tax=Diaphorobacter ruginosibacter TaxID=1715720 RepID=A0A7G9RUW3_9BURK|nr:DUF4434 domain-containing protein [Diaphorobacter ruginosibacter]